MKSPWRRLAAYALVSTTTFGFTIIISWFLVSQAGVQYLVATVLGFWMHIAMMFFINRAWTFHSKVAASRGLSVTSAVNLAALGIVLVGTAFGVEVLHLGYITARIVAGVVAGIAGFLMDSTYTFNKNPFR